MPQLPDTLILELFCPKEIIEVKTINKEVNNTFFIK
jgi:hypothetical protein